MFKINYNFALILQIVSAVALIALILLQQRGSGLSSTFGGEGGFLSYRSRRGFEKFIFSLTIAVSVLFFFISLILVTING